MYKNTLILGVAMLSIGTGIMAFHAGTVWKLGKIIKVLDNEEITRQLLFGRK